jgi:hypothetical protein
LTVYSNRRYGEIMKAEVSIEYCTV